MRNTYNKSYGSQSGRGKITGPRVQNLLKSAVDLHQRGALAQALEIYNCVLASEPKNFEALHLSGLIAYQTKNYPLGVKLMRQALGVNPKSVACLVNLGLAEHATADYEGAIGRYNCALKLQPQFAAAYYNRGNVYKDLGLWDQSVCDYQNAIEIKPDYWEALLNLAVVLESNKYWIPSLQILNRVLQINPHCIKAYNNRGNIHKGLERWRDALADYETCIKLDQSYVDAYINKANLLKDLAYFEQANEVYKMALTLEPQNPRALWNQSLQSLLRGDFSEGWKNYEARWSPDNAGKLNPYLSKLPHIANIEQWRGEQDLSDKRLLIYAEQGLGDSIQFARFVPDLARVCAFVYVAVQPSLVKLFENSKLFIDLSQTVKVLSLAESLVDCDFACPLMSLGLALSLNNSDLFRPDPYLTFEPGKSIRVLESFHKSHTPRVGLVWRGSHFHANDKYRSIALETFKSCLAPVAEFISLQKDITNEELELLSQEKNVKDGNPLIDDFLDTAVLCTALDLIICVDTSVAHLAAAMGKEVWLLIPVSPDWRWMIGRDDSPWYTNLRLYRQSEIGDWSSVLGRVNRDLISKFS